MTRLMMLIAVCLAAFALAACSGSDTAGEASPNTELVQVTITDEGLDPATATVEVGGVYTLDVMNNSSEDCTFHLGQFVRAFDVPAGGQDSIDFTIPNDEPEAGQDLGCDDDTRTGDLDVRSGVAGTQ